MILSQVLVPQDQLLTEQEIIEILHKGLDGQFARQKVLVLIPDHTRSIPLPMLFHLLVETLHDTQQLDFMVALGTHPALLEDSLCKLVGITPEERTTTYKHISLQNHAWDDPSALKTIGVMEQDEIKIIAGERWHPSLPYRVDIRINGAGGNKSQATTSTEQPFFDLPADAVRMVFDLNLMGTILPCQVFGKIMAQQKSGVILNISSMNAFQPLTRIPAYSAANAGVSNFTQWLAVHMAREYSPEIWVNAIAPGFFFTEQNRFLLTDKETGAMTPRGKSIIEHTPMARFGTAGDLLGTVLWLLSPASAFVTGIVVPVDGGFSADSGV